MALIDQIGLDKAPTEGVDIAGNLSKGLQTGMQLATAKDQIEANKLKLEEDRFKVDQMKFQAFDSMMKNLNRMNPTVAKQMSKNFKNRFQQYGFDPTIVDVTLADPQFGRAYQNMAELYSGKLLSDKQSLAQAVQSFNDAGMFTEGIAAMKDATDNQRADKQLKQQDTQFYASLKNQKDIAEINVKKTDQATKRAEAAAARQESQGLSKRLEADSIPEIVTNLKAIDSDLGGLYDPKAAAKLDKIAGEKGFIASIRIPWTQIKPFEDSAIPDSLKPLYQSISSLRNTYLKMRSGGAVTDPEADRFLQELGSGGIRTGAQLQNGLQLLNNAIVNKIKTIESGFTPDAVDILASRGNPTSSKSLPQAGKKMITPEVQAQIDEARANGYSEEEISIYLKSLEK